MRWQPRPPTPGTAAILARAERNTRATRLLDAERGRIALDWARAHALDPDDPGTRTLMGDPRLGVITLGGHGLVVEPCCDAELAVVLHVHPLAARALMADAVDLEARLPQSWAALQAGEVELWVARKVATATRDLAPDAATHVDDAIAPLLPTLPTGRLLDVLAARVVEADHALAETKAAAARQRRGAWLGRPDPDTGLQTLVARGDTETLTQVWTRLDHLAHLLAEHTDTPPEASLEELRGDALGLLANPLAALKLLVGAEHHDQPEPIADAIRDASPAMTRPRAIAYLHLTPGLLHGHGVARAEQIGALTKTQLVDLLGHHHVTLKPVIDLAEDVAADSYEIPAAIAERVHLIRPADTFPHGTSTSSGTDLDHAQPYQQPYDDTGPPAQTRVSNLAHLARTGHRTKTHHPGWHLTLRDGRSVWTTPHGYVLVTDKSGTHHLTDHATHHATHHATERPRLRIDVIRTPLQLAWAPAA
ncbi:DUF222 domain-containing protein [Nocardioides aurantiacus]|uniref:Uncharacterized protein DUF222 n=1 Tax=Nocardioides aurantiacus TaxID=86796 RepID=A0A3N2CZH5_9ACTN|nr:DUF222 domain-containing protein [Nocardioides aurantiacus]ROR92937.1 uncharacterized protein DUF222 [Nocardioides aurantiacus]